MLARSDLTHYRDDRHQDHRLISDLTWNTFRSHLILEHEVPKYDGDGSPNVLCTSMRRPVAGKCDSLRLLPDAAEPPLVHGRDVFCLDADTRHRVGIVDWIRGGLLLPQGDRRNGHLFDVSLPGQ